MHWIQQEKPVEYHVVRWENSAFHNHDKRPERKMLGGVSFDGGAGGGKRRHSRLFRIRQRKAGSGKAWRNPGCTAARA